MCICRLVYYNNSTIKKVSAFHKIVALVAVLALTMSIISLVIAVRTESLAKNDLWQWIGENRGRINQLVGCVKGNQNICDAME